MGYSTSGSLSDIPWSDGPNFIEIPIDPTGGSNYDIIGVSQLVSVPYAFHASTAEKLSVTIGEYARKAAIMPLRFSRELLKADTGNTIECTRSATLTILKDLDMEIGETINLEAHNGAILIIKANPEVEINYTRAGSVYFDSSPKSVKFGILWKIDTNSYIISGQ